MSSVTGPTLVASHFDSFQSSSTSPAADATLDLRESETRTDVDNKVSDSKTKSLYPPKPTPHKALPKVTFKGNRTKTVTRATPKPPTILTFDRYDWNNE